MERNFVILFLFILPLFLISSENETQDLSVEETLDYINKAVEKDDFYSRKKDQLKFEVNDNGVLTAQYYWGTYKAFKHVMSLRRLDKDTVERDTNTVYGRAIIRLHCKETDHCITKEFNHKPKSREIGTYEFSITRKNQAGLRVRNAFEHLIEKARSRYDDPKKKDGDDPFDP